MTPVGSLVLGAIAGVLSALAIGLKYKLGYDDSLDVVGVHLVAGLWGTIGIGFFAWRPRTRPVCSTVAASSSLVVQIVDRRSVPWCSPQS